MKYQVYVFLSCYCLLCGCSAQKKLSAQTHNSIIAFPGVQGFGKYTTGGRGGKVMVVSNLNDGGPGSFRQAATATGKRIIVFAVSGTIHLSSQIRIKGDVTIAGQTAPGDGICLADRPVKIFGDNVIIRYMRFRMGDRSQEKAMAHGSGHDDALSALRRKNIIIDHCSLSWSTDEVLSIYLGDSTTVQWNLIAEPLNYSFHFEKGDKDFEQHGFGGIWGGQHFSGHHNLFAHCFNRTPRFDGVRNTNSENVDFRNNVIYNWGKDNVYAGEGGNYNVVNNYYKPGPSTLKRVQYDLVNPWRQPPIPFGKWYVAGNYMDGSPAVTEDNSLGVVMGSNGTEEDKRKALLDEPIVPETIETQSALDAYRSVLENVGASYRRDTLDQRILDDVRNRTGRVIDVQGGFSHKTSYKTSMIAWPILKSEPTPQDSDADGMPDDWEIENKLDPNNSKDAALFMVDKNYTNIEVYINGLTGE